VAQTAGGIGYVEYAYALQNHLAHANMINKSGAKVTPSLASFGAAAAGATWDASQGFYTVVTNADGATSWPIAGATFILIHKQVQDPAAAHEALKFFDWAYANGSKMAQDLDYVPMPAPVVAAIKKLWASDIKDTSGKPIYAMSN